jgi:hypothetical protein
MTATPTAVAISAMMMTTIMISTRVMPSRRRRSRRVMPRRARIQFLLFRSSFMSSSPEPGSA